MRNKNSLIGKIINDKYLIGTKVADGANGSIYNVAIDISMNEINWSSSIFISVFKSNPIVVKISNSHIKFNHEVQNTMEIRNYINKKYSDTIESLEEKGMCVPCIYSHGVFNKLDYKNISK